MPHARPKSGRTIVLGDVHGCRDEAERLLELLRLGPDDALYFLGDLVSRGPDPAGVLALIRRTGARSVRGNHDDALLRWHDAKQHGIDTPIKTSERELAERFDAQDWQLLESLPLFIDVPENDLRLVHGGIVPGVPIERQPPEALLSMRYLGPHGEPIEKGGTVLWGTRYQGPPHVVFGHNANPQPQIHPWATGIDTGVVYGHRLTALVLDQGERVPAPELRRDVLFSVPAKKQYFVPARR
jgi:predicted phosphodiesterase